MLPTVSIVIPIWNREHTLDQCIKSLVDQDYDGSIDVLLVDDQSVDGTAALAHRWAELARMHPRERTVRLQFGPGRSNWRPGAIHRPFFEHALTSKADYVAYQFSDDYSSRSRISMQIEGMQKWQRDWSFCGRTIFVNAGGQENRRVLHDFDRATKMVPATGPTLPVYSFLVKREPFVSSGACDYPMHAGACAEAWIIAHCGIMGDPYVVPCSFFFREHNEALGHGQGPQSQTYKDAVAHTGFLEQDHWLLWRHIEHVYNERVGEARKER